MAIKFFDQLGDQIERRWRAEGYNEDVFPAISTDALEQAKSCNNVNPWDVIDWLFDSADIPPQRDIPGRFSDVPITLYDAPRFHVDLYFWLDGTTSIHQHSFSGAFQVLAGSSIHSTYQFHQQHRINQHFLTGDIRLNNVEFLQQGTVRPIQPGSDHIHSLFHLDRPSATICVRTQHTASGPQYDYRKPYFAIDPFFADPRIAKVSQSATLLLRARHPDAIDKISRMLYEADFHTAFTVLGDVQRYFNSELENVLRLKFTSGQFETLADSARRKHGRLVDLGLAVLEENKRQDDLAHRRSQIEAGEHRFFLALLLSVQGKQHVLDLVRERFPAAHPIDTVLDWVEELSATKLWHGSEPNVLGVANLDDDYLFALRCLLEGIDDSQINQAFAKEFSPEYAATLGDRPRELCASIRKSVPFRSLFVGDDK